MSAKICSYGNCSEEINQINPRTKKPYYYCKKHRAKRNKRNKQLYCQHRDTHKKRQNKHLKRIRFKFLEMYGGCCEYCKESIEEFLTLDHVKGDGKKERTSFCGKPANSWKAYRNAIKKLDKNRYQILCMNCNFAKSNKEALPEKIMEKIDKKSTEYIIGQLSL